MKVGTSSPHTSAVRAFGSGYFRDSASVLEPRHIGTRPKGTPFWPRLSPEAIESLFCLGCKETEAIGVQYFFFKFRRTFGLGYGMNRGHIVNFAKPREFGLGLHNSWRRRFDSNAIRVSRCANSFM